jgi:hypothetical protein
MSHVGVFRGFAPGGELCEGAAALVILGRNADHHTRSDTMLYSLISLIIFALDIWAIINVVRSQADTLKKVLWVALIALLPVVGLIIWALMGPRGNMKF